MSGSAGLFNKKKIFFYLGSPKVGGAGDGKHKKNTATPKERKSISSFKRQIKNMYINAYSN